MEYTQKHITEEERLELFETLKNRFEKNKNRHPKITWETVLKRLEMQPTKWWSLLAMENTGGEPDVIDLDSKTGEITFCDCAPESPKGRRSLCFDHAALEARKENKPADSASNMAAYLGIEMLDEVGYKKLQSLGVFDAKTSSWIATPAEIRKLGGALFADFRFNHVFVYHNGAESYYAARGFRGILRV